MYLNESGILGNPLIYEVRPIRVPPTNSNILSSTTVLQPGDINGECFMTKGHFHEIRDRGEIYVTLTGEGHLVMATENGLHAVERMVRGAVNYIPGGWAHRSVNVGPEPLVFFAAYVGDAGHDYATIEERGFPLLIVKDDHGPRIIENPRYRS
jgi:glucose-6-phosphate isomerase